MKEMTVQELPPEVGGVLPDSKPPSLMTEPVGQEVVGLARVRAMSGERTSAKRIFDRENSDTDAR